MNRLAALLLLLALIAVPCFAAPEAADPVALHLREHWHIQSACKLSAPDGTALSQPGVSTKGWIPAEVPSTVIAAQLAAGVFAKDFADPLYADNLRKIPGTDYPIGTNFSERPMSKDSPYACAWWYRTEFTAPAAAGEHLVLHFQGINYRANIWLNGHKVADSKDVAGAYRLYEFDVTSALKPGANVLAVETFAPTETDLGINWVDWNPMPADKEMGLWGDVFLTISGPVSLRHPQVITHLPGNNLDRADLTLNIEAANHTSRPVTGKLVASFNETRVEQSVTLAPNESRTITFTPEAFPALRLKHPALWWPAEMGKPILHTLHTEFIIPGAARPSDRASTRFGIREITSQINDKGARVFRVNGKPILIRGGGWSSDIFLRHNKERMRTDFQYVRDMGLNTIRLEGKLETDYFFDLADSTGILVMAGWCCCDHWEHWDKWQPGDLDIARESLRTQALRLRSHPSLLVWLNGSDGPPPANVESAYIATLESVHWPNPVISSASQTPTTVTGNSGVKMTGPYDYVSPNYWLVDHDKYGGAYGFNTETSPGPAIPSRSCLKRFLPANHLWPADDQWNFHAGGGGFKNLDVFNAALNATYGSPANLDDYINKSQLMAYDGERAMFEAYARNKYTSTGVIQWMLNNAWPSLIWHLYDYYQQPAGGYFGVKKACEPLHIQYSYDDHSIVLVNSTQQAATGLVASATVFDLTLKQTFRQVKTAKADADTSERVLLIPPDAFTGDSVHFVQLELHTTAGKPVSSNFYWIPSKHTDYNWEKTEYTHTPALNYEDMQALQKLPKVKLQVTASDATGHPGEAKVTVHNPGHGLALQVSLELQGDSLPAPVLWEDNYFTLMPGASRTVTVTYPAAFTGAKVAVGGFNITPESVALAKP